VLDAVDVSVALGGRPLLRDVTWRLGPGQRVALLGANGAGKTTLLSLLAGDRGPDTGVVQRGQTVRLAELTQDTAELPEGMRVIDALESVRGRVTTSGGQELTATSLAERFGFRGEKLYTSTDGLSGGERRRLQLMRLLMDEPNVLLLDEPTNDLDIDTLTALEDLLDGWPGTLVIVSHDRYFVERVCDDVYALPGDGSLRHLPGGVDEYLSLRPPADARAPASVGAPAAAGPTRGAARQAVRRELARVERELERAERRDAELQAAMADAASDAPRLSDLSAELADVAAQREAFEASWLELSEQLEG
jgi:ATP-binding cassette subfamily F protein uup